VPGLQEAICSILPPSLFYFAGGYVETSYGGQAILDYRFKDWWAKTHPNTSGLNGSASPCRRRLNNIEDWWVKVYATKFSALNRMLKNKGSHKKNRVGCGGRGESEITPTL